MDSRELHSETEWGESTRHCGGSCPPRDKVVAFLLRDRSSSSMPCRINAGSAPLDRESNAKDLAATSQRGLRESSNQKAVSQSSGAATGPTGRRGTVTG